MTASSPLPVAAAAAAPRVSPGLAAFALALLLGLQPATTDIYPLVAWTLVQRNTL